MALASSSFLYTGLGVCLGQSNSCKYGSLTDFLSRQLLRSWPSCCTLPRPFVMLSMKSSSTSTSRSQQHLLVSSGCI